jgi:hypothetical protein
MRKAIEPATSTQKSISFSKSLTQPRRFRDACVNTIDAVRNFGNFSAHPIDDKTALQIIDVDPHEAEWCLQILEESFEHFYVGPAIAKARRTNLDAKLAAAGKPPSKG